MRDPHAGWTIDPDDPRAPPLAIWDRLSAEQREAIVDALPSEFAVSEASPPEGDPHFEEKARVRDILRRWFRRRGRSVYLACELPVYYPGERMFAPDVMAVVDVPTHSRQSWVVANEGRGLSLALEIHVRGRAAKDLLDNVDKLGRLKVPEYFVFDVPRARLRGWRLPPDGRGPYVPIVPQGGRYACRSLDLDLVIDNGHLRPTVGDALLPDSDELVERLTTMVDSVTAKKEEEALRAEDEARRAEDEARRAEDEALRADRETLRADEATRRADRLEAELRALRAELERSNDDG